MMQAIIVDLDRTLLHTDKTVSQYTIGVLKKCKEKGIEIMVATARPLRSIKQYMELVDFDAITVSNGARIICDNKMKEYGMRTESAIHVLDKLVVYEDLLITVETGDCAYSRVPISDYDTVICDNLVDVAKREGTYKIIVGFDKEETIRLVEDILTEDLYYTIANGHLLQILSKEATKWNGIKTMLDIKGYLPQEAIYFGDDYDDLEPIKMCGVGVSVANGIEEVKSVADYVTASNDDDGVAKFIKEYLHITE